MKKETAIRIICSLLVLLFAYAGFSKLAGHALFISQLKNFPFIGRFPVFFSWLLPAIELITTAFLFIPEYNLYGLYCAAFLLSAFTVFLILMAGFSSSLPCSCGGVIARLSWKQHIFFNLFFLMVSITGIYLYKRKPVPAKPPA